MKTIVGDNCLLMVGSHIAHDCQVGNKVIMANYASLAGHVELGNNVRIGGLAGVRQNVRIGDYAIIGGLSGVERDVIPFGLVHSSRATLQGLNLVGMNRAGFDKQQTIEATRAIEEIFTAEGLFINKINKAKTQYSQNDIIQQIIQFLTADTTRSFCHLRK
jgi:UDP-N-acetylglucosamine acyltransferase